MRFMDYIMIPLITGMVFIMMFSVFILNGSVILNVNKDYQDQYDLCLEQQEKLNQEIQGLEAIKYPIPKKETDYYVLYIWGFIFYGGGIVLCIWSWNKHKNREKELEAKYKEYLKKQRKKK